MSNLTKEQVESIPELLKTMKVKEVAAKFGVKSPTISYWIAEHKKRGMIINLKRGRTSKLDGQRNQN